MEDLKITVVSSEGEIRCEAEGQDQVLMVYMGEYQPGDSIVFETRETDAYYVIRVDDCMDEAYVYVTAPKIVYTIPFHEKKISYNPKCFTGERHYITMRKAREFENSSYRNLAKMLWISTGIWGVILMRLQMWRPEASLYLPPAMPSTEF